MLGAYDGSSNITDSKIKELNNSYFNEANNGAGYTSTRSNMKAVAYMLDTSIWNKYAMTDKAEYAIGGPTVELLFKSYNKKYSTQYKAQATSATGYQISKDNGTTWANSYSETILSKSDSLYVINTEGNAHAMWLASPTANYTYGVMLARYKGDVGFSSYNIAKHGFRPLVCLKSGIQLEKQSDETYHINYN